MNRAFSVLTVKAVDEDSRVIRGTATTPTPDRMDDVVEPLGVEFKNPMPLLWQHQAAKPVGSVKFSKPTKNGIEFEAQIAKIDEPGTLKDRLDEAWQSVKLKLVSAVSIGFRAIEYAYMDNGGIRFIRSEVYELSLVTIPANSDATINVIRSLDDEALAATGRLQLDADRPIAPADVGLIPDATPRVVRLTPIAGDTQMNVAEQIQRFEAARVAKAARMSAIMEASAATDQTLDAEQAEEYENLSAELKTINEHLKRLASFEQMQVSTAKAVSPAPRAEPASLSRDPHIQIKAQPKLAPGMAFARIAKVKAISRMDNINVVEVATSMYGPDSDVVGAVKAVVVPGSTASGNWAVDLVGAETSAFADFAEFLRPQTILGKFGTGGIPSLRNVPFREPLISQTGGGAGYWVGEGKPKPLTSFDFDRTTLTPLKVANIAVLTEENIRSSAPSSEAIVRDSLRDALVERLDIDFVDPGKSASANVSPASITNGVTPIGSSGNDAADIREDIRALMGAFIAANNAPTSGVFIMSAMTALALSLMQNPLGQTEFPGINMNGGIFMGLPAIISEYLPSDTGGSIVILVKASDVYLGDEGGVTVDMSREASLEMKDSALTQDGLAGTGVAMVSLWQNNLVGLRAERIIAWKKRRASAVAYLNNVNWGAAA